MHPNLVHIDDVETIVIDRGPLQARRQRLAAAAGARRIGLSRYVLGSGERPMPVHVHADEEEFFFVVSGGGVSWQDGKAWAVSAGDTIVHPANGAAHAIVAGDEGMEVLAYGTGSDTGMTYLPRAKAWWMGPRWLPDDGPNPFVLEAEAGPLELPELEAQRPPSIVALADVEAGETEQPGYHECWRRVSDAAGGTQAGLNHCVLSEGNMSCPPHWHGFEEECFVILEGEGQALIDLEPVPVRAGHVLVCPTAGISHALIGGPGGMTYLGYGQRIAGDYAFFPRSRKLSFRNGATVSVGEVDYWAGEA